jgi:hypothetical protein
MAEESAGEATVAEAAADAATEEGGAGGEAAAPERATLEEARAWVGLKLDEIAGTSVGRVEAVYVDAEGGEAEWILARLGRFGHHTLVPAREAVGGAGHVWVPYTRDQIRRAPKADAGSALSAAQERQLLTHYGIGSEAGRAADIASREDSAASAKPAG